MAKRSLSLLIVAITAYFLGSISVASGQSSGAGPTSQTHSLVLVDIPLHRAISIVCKTYGVECRINDGVCDDKLRLRLEDCDIQAAFTKLSEVSKVAYTMENGVYVFSPAIQASPGALGSKPTRETPAIGFRGDTQHSGQFQTAGVRELHGLKWDFVTKGNVTSTPAVLDTTVYFGSADGHFYAVDATTGTEKWRYETKGDVLSSPVIAKGLVIFGSLDTALYALDAVSGALKWKFDSDGSIFASPVVAGDVVYFGCGMGHLHAVDLSTGTLKWSFKPKDAPIMLSPTIVDGIVLVAGFKHLYALEIASQQVKWKFKVRYSGFSDPPAVGGGMVFVVADDKKYLHDSLGARRQSPLYAIDASTGQVRWKVKPGGAKDFFMGSPAFCDGIVYCGGAYGLHALDAATGQTIWFFDRGGEVTTSPSVADGLVYFGCRNKHFYAINARRGTLQWEFTTGDDETVIPLYLSTHKRLSIGLATDLLLRKLVSELTNSRKMSEIWPSPTIADGVVYFGSGKRLCALY
ncbi:MAG: PQQ-binding-like beta-propeller repeat protein [Armatimonadota bacterium]|nr:PQQ-binding-like beta-propeller repeat protein [Armatimonadota bacterium]